FGFFRVVVMQPTVRFDLKPVTMAAAISQFILELDGQQLTYDHGPNRPVAMQWPSATGLGVVLLTVPPPPISGRSGLPLEGP
ncbi:type VI secretion IcmF C-terminal domain-containing protein, partial [Pseudomonas aeruginosa]